MKIILPDGSVQEAEDELRAIRHTASHAVSYTHLTLPTTPYV